VRNAHPAAGRGPRAQICQIQFAALSGCALLCHCESDPSLPPFPSLPPIIVYAPPYPSPYRLWPTNSRPFTLLHFFLALHTTSHHGKGQTSSNEGQSHNVRPTRIVLIGDSSGSADCWQLFQQVCHHWLPSSVVHLNSFCSSSYPTQRSGNDGGYPRRQNPYAQQDDNTSYEMSDVVNPSTAHLTSNMAGDTMAAFYDEVEP
jgi:hypothetical protein